jgi:ADP-ribose pyrophosphatase YjhB (NUDIX family)
VTAIVPNELGAILMVHKTDNDLCALPGGGMDVGESMADAVVRDVKEETGIVVEVAGLVGIYSNPTPSWPTTTVPRSPARGGNDDHRRITRRQSKQPQAADLEL